METTTSPQTDELAPDQRTAPMSAPSSFRHQAFFYDGADEFLQATVPFVAEAVEREEPVLVAVTKPRERSLRTELGLQLGGELNAELDTKLRRELGGERDVAGLVRFADMEQLGRNPGRIIPAWQRFVETHASERQPVRGIGEPVWRGRSAAELDECRRHEALLNLAFIDAPAWQLLCPYDTAALDDEILQCAAHTHPYVHGSDGTLRASDAYVEPHETLAHPLGPFGGELPSPGGAVLEMRFDRGRLAIVRRIVAHRAGAAGLSTERASDLVLAVNELAANSVSYGGGHGTLTVWRSAEGLVCEIRDEGCLSDPLVGRRNPAPTQLSGRGLWLAHQMCDLVQVRSSERSGTTVRVLMRSA